MGRGLGTRRRWWDAPNKEGDIGVAVGWDAAGGQTLVAVGRGATNAIAERNPGGCVDGQETALELSCAALFVTRCRLPAVLERSLTHSPSYCVAQ